MQRWNIAKLVKAAAYNPICHWDRLVVTLSRLRRTASHSEWRYCQSEPPRHLPHQYRMCLGHQRAARVPRQHRLQWTVRNRKLYRLLERLRPSEFFAARRCASAVYAVSLCLSVCLSVRVRPKRLNVGACKQVHSTFLMPKILTEFRQGHPRGGRQIQVG